MSFLSENTNLTTLSFVNSSGQLVLDEFFDDSLPFPKSDLGLYTCIFYDAFFEKWINGSSCPTYPIVKTKLLYHEDELKTLTSNTQGAIHISELVSTLSSFTGVTGKYTLVATQSIYLLQTLASIYENQFTCISVEHTNPDYPSWIGTGFVPMLPTFHLTQPTIEGVFRISKPEAAKENSSEKEASIESVYLPELDTLKSKSSVVINFSPDLVFFYSYQKLIGIKHKKFTYYLDPTSPQIVSHQKKLKRDYKDLLDREPNAIKTSPKRFFKLYYGIQKRLWQI